MNRLNITSILASITTERDEKMQQLVTRLSDGKKTSVSPVAIRFKPAVRDFVTLVSGRLGISSAELVNILVEGIMRETLIPRQAVITHIHERFWLLMDEHRLSVLDVARLLSDWNIGLSVLESRERTMDYLTAPLLKQLSEWFYVSPRWLEGSDARPVHLTAFSDWMQVARTIKKRIQGTVSGDILTQPDIYLVRQSEIAAADITDDPGHVFTFIRRYKTINNTTIRVVECIGYCPSSGEYKTQLNAFLGMSNILFRAHIFKSVDTFYASGYLLDALKEGKVLPASALWEIQKLHRTESGKFLQNIWTEEERDAFLFPEEYITPEWSKFVSEITALNIQ
ncbi:hypothetical protein [Citrobacter koseri]|uniref:hypothetical protein n=1 Tax=Citrobacter koseri TaxID=545 RepID=UPI000E05C2BD|nr:hypothetical protein [Citrobacter koseri]STB73256.1 Uncharacterised protein [Citrobacter koseri]STT23437.1 Uncharacterised protein [Citrobacter koseri]